MTNEQINRAVTEELGLYVDGLGDGCIKRPGLPIEDIPDFCNDHNAAAEMRSEIKEDEQNQFARHVCDLAFTGNEDCRSAHYWSAINATSRQQAEAFLRMRGKWREE